MTKLQISNIIAIKIREKMAPLITAILLIISVLALLGHGSLSLETEQTRPLLPRGNGTVPSNYDCKQSDNYDHIEAPSGFLSISKLLPSCGFLTRDGETFFGIKTANLRMTADDTIQVGSVSGESKTTLRGPFNSDYIVVGVKEAKITFNFNKTENVTQFIEFFQTDRQIPVNCDVKDEIRIRAMNINQGSYVLDLTKSISDPVHIQIIDSTVRNYLFVDKPESIPVYATEPNLNTTLRISPALSECSKIYEVTEEKSFQLQGPTSRSIQSFTCANVFMSAMKSDASHFDVDFSDFIGLPNLDDELTIYDSSSSMKLFGRDAFRYKKKMVSFSGKNLTVVYTSPAQIRPIGIDFKLTVRSKLQGGVVSKDSAISIPTNGSAFYTLSPPPEERASMEIDKLSGVQLTLLNENGDNLVLDNLPYLPQTIVATNPGEKLYVKVTTRGKASGSIKYKSSKSSCGGILFGSAGSITSDDGPQNCTWLLGSKSSSLSVEYNDLAPKGCLEIYSLNQQSPVYKKCDVKNDEVLPKFVLEQSYIKLNLNSNRTKFRATVSQPLVSFIDVSKNNYQHNITSIGYPTYYQWSSKSDTIAKNNVNKSVVLTIADVDLRSGERLLLNNQEIDTTLGDIDVSNKVVNVTVERSPLTKDMSYRRGYKLITTEYQKLILSNNTTQGVIITPKNLTSVLVRASASKGNRLVYNITFGSIVQSIDLKIIDSRSILGGRLSQTNGTTTSDNLIVTMNAKSNAVLPVMTLVYKQIACNTTIDHLCDNDTRCVPADKLCKGRAYCKDESDLRVTCSSGPAPSPRIIERGASGATVFILCVLMFTFGVLGTLYGPDLYKNMEGRFRSGQYTTFSSTE